MNFSNYNAGMQTIICVTHNQIIQTTMCLCDLCLHGWFSQTWLQFVWSMKLGAGKMTTYESLWSISELMLYMCIVQVAKFTSEKILSGEYQLIKTCSHIPNVL